MALNVISDEYTWISQKLNEDCLRTIFNRYLSDNDLIICGKVDPKFNNVVHDVLLGKKKLKLEYKDDSKDNILEAIKIAGKKLQKLHIVGRLDYDFFEVINVFCPSIKTLDLELYESNSFRMDLNFTELQDLKLKWISESACEKRIPDEFKKGIIYILEKSSKLENLDLIGFLENDIEEMKFPASLKGLRIDSLTWNLSVLRKIQRECKKIQKLYLHPHLIETRDDLEALKGMGSIQHLCLTLRVLGNTEISFLSKLQNLKKLYLSDNFVAEIDLFQLFSLIPNIENLHLQDIVIKEFKNANLSKLKIFGFILSKNKHLENFQKFNSLERIIFYDWPYDWNYKTDEFWDLFFKILPHLKNVEIIEFVQMSYEDCFYERFKSITQNRERKVRIRIRNGKIIPKDGKNEKFIIEEWSWTDTMKIHLSLF